MTRLISQEDAWRQEIRQAIEKVQWTGQTQTGNQPSRIQVIGPAFKCEECGSHYGARFRIGIDWEPKYFWLCRRCRHAQNFRHT